MRHNRTVGMLLPVLALALAACATSSQLSQSTAQIEPKQKPEPVELGLSRIPQKVDPSNPQTTSPTTIITREELDQTGAVSLQDALRRSRAGVLLGPGR